MNPFFYTPAEHELEKASNSYVMSLVVVIVGLPLPIINLLATLFFFLANRKSTYFVRWHCTQALLSQFSLFCLNSVAFWWTVMILLHRGEGITNAYVAYLVLAVIFNLLEFIMTIRAAIRTRKGIHVSWWFYGPITDIICKP
jgi:uncharacterized membrane protein